MTTNHDTSKLDDLIETTIDSVNGFEHSADKAASPAHAALFRTLAGERRAIVARLQEASRSIGGAPNDFGTVAASVHRRVEDLRRALGGGEAALFAEIRRGEAYLREEYQRALRDERMAPEIRATVERCYAEIVRGEERVADLAPTAETVG